MSVLVTWLAWLALGVVAWLLRKRARAGGARIAYGVWKRAVRPGWGELLVWLVAMGLAVVLVVRLPPIPHVHDEFSYLFGAATFARGALSFPTPPAWEHLETFYIQMLPRYASMYPPGNSLALASGIAVAGRPEFGAAAWYALGCAAICWMARPWLPGGGAVVAGLLAASHVGYLENWGRSFWGGQVAMCGGALVAGGLARLTMRPDCTSAWAAGTGAALLMLTRPFEGFAFCVAGVIAAGLVALRGARLWDLLRCSPWALPPLVGGGLLLASVNYDACGSPWQMPYRLYGERYCPGFDMYGRAAPKGPRADVIPQQAAFTKGIWEELQLEQTWWDSAVRKSAHIAEALPVMCDGFAPTLFVFVLGVLSVGWRRGGGLLLVLLLASPLVNAIVIYFQPHYLAASVPLAFVCAVHGARMLARCGRRRRWWSVAVWLIVPLGLVRAATYATTAPPLLANAEWAVARARMEQRLQELSGWHLVVVRYLPRHNVHEEWVWNDPQPTTSRVVWARELEVGRLGALEAAYPDRQVWLLLPDVDPPQVLSYRDTEQQTKELARVSAVEDASFENHMALARQALATGDLGRARPALDRALHMNAHSAEAFRLKAQLYWGLGEPDEAGAAMVRSQELLGPNSRGKE